MKKEISIEEMKQLQLELLDELHLFCKENGLIYFLTGGTLIGAIRHKGFIPWDDDIDVVMPRYDYEKFVCEYNKKKDTKFKIISYNNDKGYYLPFAKLINTETILIEHYDNAKPLGVFIDVFPLDNMSDDYDMAIKLFNKTKKWRDFLTLKRVSLNKDRALYKNIILLLGKVLLKLFSVFSLVEKIDNTAKTYMSTSFSKYVCVVVLATYGYKEIVASNCYEYILEAEFENRLFWIPSGYDTILKNLYGNYMELPPVEKRVTHHAFDVWWKEETK